LISSNHLKFLTGLNIRSKNGSEIMLFYAQSK
jgi:hypothetical protein